MKRYLILAAALTPFVMPQIVHAQAPQPPAILEWKSTVKGWDNSYYWYDNDGKRYAFASTAAYQSWFPGQPTGVSQVGVPDLAPITLGGAVFHKPGVRLIKFASSPDVYAVAHFGVLRKLANEQVALELYGDDWKTFIDEVSVADFPLYRMGSTITDAGEFDVMGESLQGNPSTNVVNAANRPPETFKGTMTLQSDKTQAWVGDALTLNAQIQTSDATWNNTTIRIYDHQDQVLGTCRGTSACRITVTVGGPIGPQSFTARAFNQYEQSFTSQPVTLYVQNK
jgi:hypothetical protein